MSTVDVNSGRCAVLVVDDNDVNRMLVRRQLEKLEARPVCIETGAEALARFAAERFDVVLLDCLMPRMDGFRLAREMRRIEDERGGVRTPIVALTAVTRPRLRDEVVEAGMDDLLNKPASIGDLRGVLLRWAGTRDVGDYPVDVAAVARLQEEIDNPGAVRALLETYLRQLPLRTAGLRAAVRRGDTGVVSTLAQELRASGDPIGVVRLGRLCAELETAAAAGTPEEAERDVARIDELARATETALRDVLARSAGAPA